MHEPWHSGSVYINEIKKEVDCLFGSTSFFFIQLFYFFIRFLFSLYFFFFHHLFPFPISSDGDDDIETIEPSLERDILAYV